MLVVSIIGQNLGTDVKDLWVLGKPRARPKQAALGRKDLNSESEISPRFKKESRYFWRELSLDDAESTWTALNLSESVNIGLVTLISF